MMPRDPGISSTETEMFTSSSCLEVEGDRRGLSHKRITSLTIILLFLIFDKRSLKSFYSIVQISHLFAASLKPRVLLDAAHQVAQRNEGGSICYFLSDFVLCRPQYSPLAKRRPFMDFVCAKYRRDDARISELAYSQQVAVDTLAELIEKPLTT